jgi:hypothetical protein
MYVRLSSLTVRLESLTYFPLMSPLAMLRQVGFDSLLEFAPPVGDNTPVLSHETGWH